MTKKLPKSNEGIDLGDCADCGKPIKPDIVGYVLDRTFPTIDHDIDTGKPTGYALNPEGAHYVFCKKCGEKRVPKARC